MKGQLTGESEPFGPDDADQILCCPAKVFINNNIFELVNVGNFATRIGQAPGNHFGAVHGTCFEPLIQRFQ
jgi:hypothetical protein